MQREEKQLEALIDSVLNRLNDIKMSIGLMIHKIETEYETINWPTFLDNFALISSHVSECLSSRSSLFTYYQTVDRSVKDPRQ